MPRNCCRCNGVGPATARAATRPKELVMKSASMLVVTGVLLTGAACSSAKPGAAPGAAASTGSAAGSGAAGRPMGGGPTIDLEVGGAAGVGGGGTAPIASCDKSCSAVGKCEGGTCVV